MLISIVIHFVLHGAFCEDKLGYGVGLSISQLNNIKQHFTKENNVKSQKVVPKKNIYQNKYHNFSEKFSLEDRLLLVRFKVAMKKTKILNFIIERSHT